MSRLCPLVREPFIAKSQKYNCVFIEYNRGNKTYEIYGSRKDGVYVIEEPITDGKYKLREARNAIWEHAEIMDGLPVKAQLTKGAYCK